MLAKCGIFLFLTCCYVFLLLLLFFAEHSKKVSRKEKTMTYNKIKKQILNSKTVVTQLEISFHLTLDRRYLELTTHLLKQQQQQHTYYAIH